jgi:hypothetical protein
MWGSIVNGKSKIVKSSDVKGEGEKKNAVKNIKFLHGADAF